MRLAVILAIFFVIPAAGFSQTTWYVPDDFPTIQGAISDASVLNGDTIIVRSGTYVENIDYLGKAITVQSEHGPSVTIIDGNQVECVVTFATGEGLDAVLEGFILQNGSGKFDPNTTRYFGGGIYCDQTGPTISNNVITDNTADYGGGIYCSESNPEIKNNIISNNSVPYIGGGIYSRNSTPVITNNLIFKNEANQGGGINCFNSPAKIVNSSISGNSAVNVGGGVFTIGEVGLTLVRNTIIWNNTADTGEELYDDNGSASVVYCDIRGGWGGTGNIDGDPLFVNPSTGDLHLTWRSPCINRGKDSGAPMDDLDGDPRPYMGTVEMGADEYTGTHPLEANTFTISELTGGGVNFFLEGSVANAGRNYIMLGGISGTTPGLALPGGMAILPINWDLFTDFMLPLLNSPVFLKFLLILDGIGQGTAHLNAPPVPGFAGITMVYAYALNDPWDFVSNPIAVEIVP